MNFINNVLTPARGTASMGVFGLGAATATSGNGAREDGNVSYGFSLMRGKRPAMEDYHHSQFKKDPKTGEWVGLFGVFDGHGGPNAADYVRSNLFVNLMQHAKFNSDINSAITESYVGTDNQYLKQDAGISRDDGCTGITAIVLGQRLLVANVGDSRAVLSRAGTAVPMSVDHKPNSKEERERIETAGGVVVWAGTWRVGGVLAVSRAFGDRPLKRFVIATPDILEANLTSEDEFLLLASDGLWDVMSNQDAVSVAHDILDPEKAAKRLTEEAFSRGSNDNISCVVVRFKH